MALSRPSQATNRRSKPTGVLMAKRTFSWSRQPRAVCVAIVALWAAVSTAADAQTMADAGAAPGASATVRQRVMRGDELLVEARVRVAFISGGRARPIPKPLRVAMKADQDNLAGGG